MLKILQRETDDEKPLLQLIYCKVFARPFTVLQTRLRPLNKHSQLLFYWTCWKFLPWQFIWVITVNTLQDSDKCRWGLCAGCCMHGRIMKQWVLGHRYVKAPTPQKKKQSFSNCLWPFCISGSLVSLCGAFVSLCGWFTTFCCRLVSLDI